METLRDLWTRKSKKVVPLTVEQARILQDQEEDELMIVNRPILSGLDPRRRVYLQVLPDSIFGDLTEFHTWKWVNDAERSGVYSVQPIRMQRPRMVDPINYMAPRPISWYYQDKVFENPELYDGIEVAQRIPADAQPIAMMVVKRKARKRQLVVKMWCGTYSDVRGNNQHFHYLSLLLLFLLVYRANADPFVDTIKIKTTPLDWRYRLLQSLHFKDTERDFIDSVTMELDVKNLTVDPEAVTVFEEGNLD